MSEIFSNSDVRESYVKMIVDWMIKTYNIAESQRNPLLKSIGAMSDAAILEKGKLIENYIDTSAANVQGAERNIQMIYHELQGEMERKTIAQDDSSSLFF